MKKFWILSLLLVVSITITWCLNNKESNTENNTWTSNTESPVWIINDVVDYNNTLKDLATKCTTTENTIIETYDKNTSDENTQKAINNAIKDCENVKNKINKLWDRKWDSSLKDWVITVVEKEIEYFNTFNKLLPYLDKEWLNEKEKITYDSLFSKAESIDQELSTSIVNLTNIQEEFAQNYWFKLTSEDSAE